MDYHLTLNWPEFIERYWQKRPVVLKRGFSNFVDPISPDELAGLAMENEVDSRLVSHLDGKWQVSHGPFESYDHLGENNWSLLVQAVNHWHEPTAALMRPFRALPDWRMDDLMISFSVPGGGVGPHRPVRRVYYSGYGSPPLARGRESADETALSASGPASGGSV